jgi:cell pole-organizing protein PopZ
MKLFGFFLILLAGLALLMLTPPAEAVCYTSGYSVPSYAPSYTSFRKSFSGYSSYSTVYPVAQFVGVPIPIFGSVYIGPTGVASAAAAIGQGTGPVAQQAAAVQAAPAPVAPAPVAAAPQPNNDMLTQVLAVVKQIAAKQDAHGYAIKSLADRQDRHEQRLAAVEAAMNLPPPPPTPPLPPPPMKEAAPDEAAVPPAPPVKLDAALTIANRSCAACHLKGNHKRADSDGFVLLEAKDRRTALTDKQRKNYLSHISGGKMPPPDNALSIPPLTADEKKVLTADLDNYPIKPEAK